MNYYNIHTSDLEQYVVKPGDSLYMIAKKYNVSIDNLKQINHLVSNVIYPNQILFIPKNKICNTCNMPQGTVTQANDSINDLITKYSLTLSEISNLKVVPNQMISVREKQYYTIQVNDSIEELLMKFDLKPIELLKLNKDIWIVPGEKIIIEK
jgi:LysM repeat protein